MNILTEILAKQKGQVEVKSIIGDEKYIFSWNNPSSIDAITLFEEKIGYELPIQYKELLKVANGGIIFKSLFEEDGYKLLGIPEIERITNELVQNGYNIPKTYYCIAQCLFSQDLIMIDLSTGKIYDGDFGYPIDEWECISRNVNEFFIHLCQANGAMFWRW